MSVVIKHIIFVFYTFHFCTRTNRSLSKYHRNTSLLNVLPILNAVYRCLSNRLGRFNIELALCIRTVSIIMRKVAVFCRARTQDSCSIVGLPILINVTRTGINFLLESVNLNYVLRRYRANHYIIVLTGKLSS